MLTSCLTIPRTCSISVETGPLTQKGIIDEVSRNIGQQRFAVGFAAGGFELLRRWRVQLGEGDGEDAPHPELALNGYAPFVALYEVVCDCEPEAG